MGPITVTNNVLKDQRQVTFLGPSFEVCVLCINAILDKMFKIPFLALYMLPLYETTFLEKKVSHDVFNACTLDYPACLKRSAGPERDMHAI